MNDYFCLEVGKVFDGFENHEEGVQFEFNDGGAMLLVFFNTPTNEEIEEFKAMKRFEIRATELNNHIIITGKVGALEWFDAPYSPFLSPAIPTLEELGELEGYALTIVLIDALSGEVKHMRLIGLSNEFSLSLEKMINENLKKVSNFNQERYYKEIGELFRKYDTKQIAKMALTYCRINY